MELESLKFRQCQQGGESFFTFNDLLKAKALVSSLNSLLISIQFVLNTEELVFSKFTAIKLRELQLSLEEHYAARISSQHRSYNTEPQPILSELSEISSCMEQSDLDLFKKFDQFVAEKLDEPMLFEHERFKCD